MTGSPLSSPVVELLAALGTVPTGADGFRATAPDWFGERVFGGLVVGQALAAACHTVDATMRPHSLHAYFLGALHPGPVDLGVARLRDGRTFSTRFVTSVQDGRTALWLATSFHRDEDGDDYELPMPGDIPAPESVPVEQSPPPFELRPIGPTEQRADGTYRSTGRSWVRTVDPMPDDPLAHLGVAAFLSDMTGTSFRPHSLGEWGTHTDASIDHAAWFHRPFRVDEWLYSEFQAVVNTGGRSTVRGVFFDHTGRLCMSMAQELLIRPLSS